MKKPEFIVIGRGGREHAIIEVLGAGNTVYSLGGSDAIHKIATPLGKNYSVSLNSPMSPEILEQILEKKDAIVVIGSEDPLANGWVDQILEKSPNHKILGPSKNITRLESSKWSGKKFLQKYKIPTPKAVELTREDDFFKKIEGFSSPYVIKADGLASGKGVAIFENKEEAFLFTREILQEKRFGNQDRCLIEEYTEGTELSLLLLLDGRAAIQLGMARDYKTLRDKNQGPNTGGMGCYTPLSDITAKDKMELFRTVIRPLLRGLEKEDLFYKGFLFIGLIKTKTGFQVLELNVRLGDPEAQTVLPLLKNRISDFFVKAVEGNLSSVSGEEGVLQKDSNFWTIQSKGSSVCVVLASPGYPRNPQIGIPLPRLNEHLHSQTSNLYLFQSGTKKIGEKWATSQGRVLSVVALHQNLGEARTKCYDMINRMSFTRLVFRNDIALLDSKQGISKSLREIKTLVHLFAETADDLLALQDTMKGMKSLKISWKAHILPPYPFPESFLVDLQTMEEKGSEIFMIGAKNPSFVGEVFSQTSLLPILTVSTANHFHSSSSNGSVIHVPWSKKSELSMFLGRLLGGKYPLIREALHLFKAKQRKTFLLEDQELQNLGLSEFLKKRQVSE